VEIPLMNKNLFSIHWELRTLLYLGVLLLSAGLGTWVYQHLDSIDRLGIVGALCLISAGGFFWCARAQPRFSFDRVASAGPLTDYVLLLACLTFVTLVGYLQFQYTFFGPSLRLAGLVPLLVLAFSAYYFDHLGVLSLAITNLAAWVGIVVTPANILTSGTWATPRLIYTGLLLGLFLLVAGRLTVVRRWKEHFAFTYAHFGIHIWCIACLSGMFHDWDQPWWAAWLALLLGSAWALYYQALRYHSFYFLVIIGIYTYIGISSGVIHLVELARVAGDAGLYLLILYFIGSALSLAVLVVRQNKKWRRHDRV
jgi:hypothetical protein